MTSPREYSPSRSEIDMNEWFRTNKYSATMLDLFDSFDELDYMMGKNFYWINQPEYMQHIRLIPKVPQKYRITLDCSGYNPNSITTEFMGRTLVVSGHEEHRHSEEEYSLKEFRKTFEVPENTEFDNLASFMTPAGSLIIELPLKETEHHPNFDLIPKMAETKEGKVIKLNFSLPDNVDRNSIWLYLKDRDLVVKSEDKSQNPDSVSKFFYYKRATLPENTEFDMLKCYCEDNNKLVITAPLKADYKGFKPIPIEFKIQ